MSLFFSTVSKILGIQHRTSASSASRTNGYSENSIKKLNQGFRLYSTPEMNDLQLEDLIPLIHIWVRATPAANSGVSAFECLHGYKMPLPITFDKVTVPTFYSSDATKYVTWLRNTLTLLHTAVRANRWERKQEMKHAYDARHNVKEPTFQVGQKVLLRDPRIKAGATQILTKKPYVGTYIVKEVVQNSENIGPAYKLVNEQTGKEIARLVNYDRLKLYKTEEKEK